MTTAAPITTPIPVEYANASAAVRAVFDDIKTTRNVPDVNNFWKYLGATRRCSRAPGRA